MAVNSYILINVEPAMTGAVLEQLRSIPGAMVHEVLGPFDVIVDLETDTQEDATGILRNKVRPIHGVTNTVTCVCI